MNNTRDGRPIRLNITIDVDPRYTELVGVGQESDATQVISAVREPSFWEILHSPHVRRWEWNGKFAWLDESGMVRWESLHVDIPEGWSPILLGPTESIPGL